MRVQIRAFGIAKDIIQGKSMEYQMENGRTVSELKASLIQKFPEFKKLSSLSFAVNGEYVGDTFELNESDEIVLIPPVSGG